MSSKCLYVFSITTFSDDSMIRRSFAPPLAPEIRWNDSSPSVSGVFDIAAAAW